MAVSGDSANEAAAVKCIWYHMLGSITMLIGGYMSSRFFLRSGSVNQSMFLLRKVPVFLLLACNSFSTIDTVVNTPALPVVNWSAVTMHR